MAAAAAAEAGAASSNAHGEDEEGIMRAAKAFFWQSPGAAAPYLLALILVASWGTPTSSTTGVQATLLFASGAIPAAIVLWASYRSSKPAPSSDAGEPGSHSSVRKQSPLDAIREHPEYAMSLLGTGGTWCAWRVGKGGGGVGRCFGSRAAPAALEHPATVLSAASCAAL